MSLHIQHETTPHVITHTTRDNTTCHHTYNTRQHHMSSHIQHETTPHVITHTTRDNTTCHHTYNTRLNNNTTQYTTSLHTDHHTSRYIQHATTQQHHTTYHVTAHWTMQQPHVIMCTRHNKNTSDSHSQTDRRLRNRCRLPHQSPLPSGPFLWCCCWGSSGRGL